eukprot:scaffold17482_cov90-Isochrysis_galbana.AAC.1
MEKNGIILKSNSSWASRVVLVTKKDGVCRVYNLRFDTPRGGGRGKRRVDEKKTHPAGRLRRAPVSAGSEESSSPPSMPVSPVSRTTPQQGAKDAILQANLEALVDLLKTSEAANDQLCARCHSGSSGPRPVPGSRAQQHRRSLARPA